MTEIKTHSKSPATPAYGGCMVSTSGNGTELKSLDSEKPCWSNIDQREVAVKSGQPSGGCCDSQETVELSATVEQSETKTEGPLKEGGKSVPGVNQEKSGKNVKSELAPSREETEIQTPVLPNSRPVQYVIVPSSSNAISEEELQRFALICKQETDGNKVSVTIAGPGTSLVSADGKTMGFVSSSKGRLNPKTETPLGENPVKMERPEGSPAALDASLIQNSLSAYTTILPRNQSTSPAPENRLPGTSLVYKTPGANNMNKNGKIKRPMNAFMVWARTYRAKMAEAFPNTTNSDVSVRLGQVWHEMTDEQKRPYYREAERIKQRHKMLYPEWSYTPSPARKKPEEAPAETAESVAHSIYWARYGGGSIRAVQEAANQLLTEGCSPSPGSTLPQPTTDQTIPSKGIVTSISNVYKPVPLKSAAINKKESLETSQEPNTSNTYTVTVETEKEHKSAKHDKRCPLSNEPSSSSKSGQVKDACMCTAKGQKKRQRKPRVRRKDRSDMGENVPGGPHADTRSRRLSGKYLDPPSPAADALGTLCAENDYPSDPYNPFYFLNLGREYVDKAEPDDVDIDSWRTYLGEKSEQTQPYLHELDYNLDVFLSEARVSGSTTSVASSDIDIVPTPLASTLDRLQKTANDKSKTKSARNRQPRGGTKTKSRESRSQKTNKNHSDKSASKAVCDLASVSSLNTPRLTASKSMAAPTELLPDANDLFVIKEEVVVTTYATEESSLQPGHLSDTGGAGDSKASSFTPKPVSAKFGAFPNEGGFFEDVPTISPPGKKPCV